MKKANFFFLMILWLPAIFLTKNSRAQDADSVIVNVQKLPKKYYSKVDKKISSADRQLSKKSAKYLAKFQRQEKKLQKKLQKIHPENEIADAGEKYNELSQKIKSKAANAEKIAGGEYNPYLDSLGTSLSFLKQFNGIGDKAKEPLASLGNLQIKLQQSEKIKAFIAERKSEIKETLSR